MRGASSPAAPGAVNAKPPSQSGRVAYSRPQRSNRSVELEPAADAVDAGVAEQRGGERERVGGVADEGEEPDRVGRARRAAAAAAGRPSAATRRPSARWHRRPGRRRTRRRPRGPRPATRRPAPSAHVLPAVVRLAGDGGGERRVASARAAAVDTEPALDAARRRCTIDSRRQRAGRREVARAVPVVERQLEDRDRHLARRSTRTRPATTWRRLAAVAVTGVAAVAAVRERACRAGR